MRLGSTIADLLRLRPQNVRNRLLRDLALLIALTSGAIVAVTVWNARSTHKRIAQSQIEQASVLAAQEFESQLTPVERGLAMAWEWGRMGLVDPTRDQRTMEELTPVLRPLDKVTAAIVADADGREVYLAAERTVDGQLEGWTTRKRYPEKGDKRYLQKSWSPDGKLLGESWIELPGYDPKDRPWFGGAVGNESEDTLFRSVPYQLYAENAYGISQSLNWTNREGVESVVAFDMLLSGILEMVDGIDVSKNGVAFLCNSSGDVFLPSAPPVDGVEPPVFVKPAEANNPLVSSALRAWGTAGSVHDERPLRFESSDGSGWAGFRLLDAASGLWIGVAVPDPDIFGTEIEGASQLLIIVSLIFVMGLLLAVMLVRKYAPQLRDVPKQLVGGATFEEDVRALIERGEGATVEFKSTVRRNLKTGKNAKEIELAWLKSAVAFMNTDGGTLLIGVGDHGEICGTGPDEFESEDRCRLHLKNLVNQHIGAEFARLIRFQVQEIDGEAVVAVQCERSPKPVFLRHNNKESFYVRSGPSSAELSSRQVLEYVQSRS